MHSQKQREYWFPQSVLHFGVICRHNVARLAGFSSPLIVCLLVCKLSQFKTFLTARVTCFGKED